jgi:hypothetical protein
MSLSKATAMVPALLPRSAGVVSTTWPSTFELAGTIIRPSTATSRVTVAAKRSPARDVSELRYASILSGMIVPAGTVTICAARAGITRARITASGRKAVAVLPKYFIFASSLLTSILDSYFVALLFPQIVSPCFCFFVADPTYKINSTKGNHYAS